MAALNFVSSPETDFSGGIDARSAENMIDPGFLRDLLNADIIEKRPKTREGYQGYAGNIPVRVSGLTYLDATNEILLTLDSAVSISETDVDLAVTPSSPLILYGRSSNIASGGPFTTAGDTARYYSQFTVPTRKTYVASSSEQTLLIPQSEYGIETTDMLVNVVKSTSTTDRSFEDVEETTISINESTGDLTVTYTNGTGSDFNVFTYYKDQTPVVGESYTASIAHPGGTGTYTITAATHALANFNILVQLQQDVGASRVLAQPDVLEIAANGDVTVQITGSSGNYYLILTTAPIASQASGNVNGFSTQTVEIENLTSPWIFYSIYREQTPGGTKELVFPESLTYDDATKVATVTFNNTQGNTPQNFFIYYDYGFLRSNLLSVVDPDVTVNANDTKPQLTIWGLDHSEIYNTATNSRAGWVSHIDSYKSSAEQRVISGLGGNLFAARTFAEVGEEYLYGQLWPNLQARTATTTTIGPLFYDTGDVPARSRGYILSSASGLGWVKVTSVAYDTVNTWTKYTLSVPGMQILDSAGAPTTLGSVLSTTSGLEDWLTIQNMSYARHNGTFRIRQATAGVNQIEIWVENNNDISVDYNDTATTGEAGVFTDQLTWLTTAPFIAGDVLQSAAFGTNQQIVAVVSSGSMSVVSGVMDLIEVAGGILTSGKRTSNIIPLRTSQPSSTASVVNIVRGDMLSYTGIPRLLRVLDVDITAKTITIDEELTWSDSINDSVFFTVVERWIPIEAPDDSYNLTPSTYVRQLDADSYGSQAFLRSTMVQNNMYFTDGRNEVLKFDGQNVYRAGLFPWQPGLFVTIDTAATARIVVDNPKSTPTAIADNVFTVPLGDENKFPTSARIRHSFTGGYTDYSVVGTYDDGTNGFVKVQRISTAAITLGSSPRLTLLSTRRYYFRLNAVDVNNNIIASAVTGYQDHVVELAEDAAVQLKLVGMPAWDIYDYDRLEVEIYATKTNQPAPFYRLTTLQQGFDNTLGYILYTDSFSDNDLFELDSVSTALKGTELGVSWQEPLRAKHITSINNRLVMANIKDYPQLDIQLSASGAVTNTTYTGKRFLFRKDNADTLTTTNMLDRIGYEFVSAATGDTSNFVIGTDEFTFDATGLTTEATGDWVYLYYSSVDDTGRDLTYSGWWQIASVGSGTITINLVGAAAAGSYPDKFVVASDPADVPVLLGTDGNLGQVNGDSFDLFDTMRRMSLAINASQRMTDVSLTPYSSFVPWLVARGGNDVGKAGRLLVRTPKVIETTPEVVLPSTFSGGGASFQVFVNDIRRQTSAQVSAITRLYPSRVLVSYENYPEIFDSPTAVLDVESDSAIDINPADGQEITGVLPFFGDSAFGAAMQSAILVIFKTNSIYLVDINEKKLGRNPVQRIETEGLGCTAPNSIAVSKGAICFANESGIYALRRNQAIDYLGLRMERNWTERVNLDALDLCQGHHYGVGRRYKLSVPLRGETQNSEVYVYNHTGEQEGRPGAWSRYDNHPATGWANLGSNAYFGATVGRVFSIRNTGDDTDYRDDSSPITFHMDTRDMDFGAPGIRKVVDNVVVNYRTAASVTNAELLYSIDLTQEYSETTPVTLTVPNRLNGLSDLPGKDIIPIRSNLDRRRGIYFRFRIQCNQLDAPLEVAGMTIKVGGLSVKGITQAQQTRT